MSVSKLASLFSLVALTSFSVAACASNTDPSADSTEEDPTASDQQDLSMAKITACTADADCVAVPVGGCCGNGYNAAVNKHHTKAYENSSKCTANPRPMCPRYLVHDTRVAQCNEKAGKCEMVAPKDCRTTGCSAGATCQMCWANFACVPKGAMC
jgi:hypothetical protein